MKGLALLASSLLLSSCAHSNPPNELVGNYYLQGVMEMGSQLSLKKDNTFEAVVEYGSADGYAKGLWAQDGTRVTLHRKSDEPVVAQDISQFFDEMVLIVGNDCLTIEGSRGCYVKVPKRQASE